jgi:hypothetical protein
MVQRNGIAIGAGRHAPDMVELSMLKLRKSEIA